MAAQPHVGNNELRVVQDSVRVINYYVQREHWPRTGRVIMAQFTDDAVLVYQAYNKAIAQYAVEHGHFVGAPGWSATRMSWVKTSFMWMMYRSGWGSKHNQEATLGIWLKRNSFIRLLQHAREVGTTKESNAEREVVRLQWDPSHSPGDKGKHVHNVRRDIQLGLKNVKTFANGEDIVKIVDLSQFVKEQAAVLRSNGETAIDTPLEQVLEVSEAISTHLDMNSSS